jgi:methyl-accepting chemotaxis protein
MNRNSIGVKIVAVSLSIITIMTILALVIYYTTAKQKIIDQELTNSKNLILASETIRRVMADKWDKNIFTPELLLKITRENSSDQEKRAKILSTVPIVSSWKIIEEQTIKSGFRFKPVRINARNPKNEANAIEREALTYFQNNPGASEYTIIDDNTDELRYFRPVKLSGQCIICHGNPNSSYALWQRSDGRDILGYPMENSKPGDLHGAFEIIKPLAASFSAFNMQFLQITGATLIALLFIALVIYQSANRILIIPLTNLALKLQNISKGTGNLSERLEIKGKSEFDWLSGSYNGFVKKIAKTIDEIRLTSEKLATAAEQLASITENTEQGVLQQQTDTSQVASAMEEMTATVQEVARNAVQASEAAASTDTVAKSGKQVVDEAVNAINSLASEVQSAADVIQELEKDSENIGQVLTVIQGIAEQTNLLALNAAIEAARAGEQGRGFAVVADEVRTLASRTQNSTHEIQQTVEGLQVRARNAVKVMEQGQLQAKNSVQQAASAGEVLEQINSKIHDINDMNNQIACAAEEQTAVAEEINRSICKIGDISEQTSTGASNTSQACIELKELAVDLKTIVGHFKT